MDFKKETVKISVDTLKEQRVKETLAVVYDALKQKGYDPISQIVAYLMSDDPTFITGFNNARVLISKLERDEILEELVKTYLSAL